jgi:hypothetical protein
MPSRFADQRTRRTKSFQRPFERDVSKGILRLCSKVLAFSSVLPERTLTWAVSPRAPNETAGEVPRVACHWAKIPHLCGARQSDGNSVENA